MAKIIDGNPEDLIFNEDGVLCCPHCKEALRITQLDMGSNHSLYHTCSVKVREETGIAYKYYGRELDLRRLLNGEEKKKKED